MCEFHVDGGVERDDANILSAIIYFDSSEKGDGYCKIYYNTSIRQMAVVSVPWDSFLFQRFKKINIEILDFAADQFQIFLEKEREQLPLSF